MKRFIAILTALCICLAASGCGTKNPGTEPAAGGAPGPAAAPASEGLKLVKKPNKTKYLLSNGIEVKYQDESIETPKGTVRVYLPRISGLVDKNLEARINQSIVNDITDGIRKNVDEINPDLYSMMEGTTQFNANNLLSVSVQGLYSPPMLGFLYRLTDGQRLYLKDIFTEGTDYVPLVNQKVIEGLVGGGQSEETTLREPFTTIRPDQGFCFARDKLYIIFNSGEAGFARGNAIGIPMDEIDDYVDVADRYSGTERKTQERGDLIVRNNNIFVTEKGDIYKKGRGAVWSHYPRITGLRDSGFEDAINGDISAGLREVLDSGALEELPEPPRGFREYSAVVEMTVAFNHYGILTIERRLENYGGYRVPGDFNRLYSYDLLNKKRIIPESILARYIERHPEEGPVFTGLVKESLRENHGGRDPGISAGLEHLDYTSILSSGEVYFDKRYQEETQVVVSFGPNTLAGNTSRITARVPLKAILQETPEEFFAP
ncbi:MAG: hypothetical protein HPY50_14370 [Firmicutes bacterium]|nr:hypothetical protein [Bacillota bacterium]